MKKEKSCGAIIYRIKNKKLEFLILKMQLGHYSNCKGHMEKGETESATALREIKEETNLEVELDTSFSHKITYSPAEGVIKDVIFFVATPISGTLKVQEAEVSEALWLTYDKAYRILTYDQDKRTLSLAYRYLLTKLGGKSDGSKEESDIVKE